MHYSFAPISDSKSRISSGPDSVRNLLDLLCPPRKSRLSVASRPMPSPRSSSSSSSSSSLAAGPAASTDDGESSPTRSSPWSVGCCRGEPKWR
ncbi:hypothetical protein PUN28_018557 [Cardiocondyla obscurior]|uniref:Uncharacterized protein n=1 Tax=Cardiocondyla obscurior TaxID=286306 RepID=A0AAW2EKA5_9HYME